MATLNKSAQAIEETFITEIKGWEIEFEELEQTIEEYKQNSDLARRKVASVKKSVEEEMLRQQNEIDICTNWRLLKKLSQKRLIESLQNAGQSADTIGRYVLAWKCYQELYAPEQPSGTRRLQRPSEATWQRIVQLYDTLQHTQLTTPGAESNPETIEKWLSSCAKAVRAYLYPNMTSLKEHGANAKPYPNQAALPSIWEAINGTAISFGNTKMVLIPTEALDIDEFRVPQEWVDIPNWVADYYLAVQVNVESRYIRIWGYTTHAQLKNQASYDAFDKAYCLDSEELISLSILWLSQQLCPDVITRAEVAPLPELPLDQAQNLIQRLGNPNIIIPRTQIPFTIWGALLQHGGWRQRLYEQRQGQQQWSVAEWLQNGVSDFARIFGWATVDTQAFASARGSNVIETSPTIARRLTINSQQCELRVRPQGNITSRIWRFELRALPGELLATGVKLRLLTEDLQPFEGNEVQVINTSESIYLEVALGESPEGLVWQIEPTPDNFELEILYI